MNEDLGFVEPRIYGPHRPVQARKRRQRGGQTPEPPAQGGGISYAIGVFDRGRRGLPATALDKVAPHRVAAGNEAVLCVRWRELREKGEGLVARSANATPNQNPIVLLIVSLFAPAAMSDNGVMFTNGAPTHDYVTRNNGPIAFNFARLRRQWDKKNRSQRGLRSDGD